MAKVTKKEPVASTEAYGDIIETRPSESVSRSEEPHQSRSFRCRSKIRQEKREDRHIKRYSRSLKSLKKMCALQSESESETWYYQLISHMITTVEHEDPGW